MNVVIGDWHLNNMRAHDLQSLKHTHTHTDRANEHNPQSSSWTSLNTQILTQDLNKKKYWYQTAWFASAHRLRPVWETKMSENIYDAGQCSAFFFFLQLHSISKMYTSTGLSGWISWRNDQIILHQKINKFYFA